MTTSDRRRARLTSLDWWVHDADGNVAVAQPPNPPLLVWLCSLALGRTALLGEARAHAVANAGRGALVVWCLEEMARGASPARRGMGTAVLAVVLARFVSSSANGRP